MISLEALQDALDADGLANAGFSIADDAGTEGAMIALDPPVVVWLAHGRVELRADLGAIPDSYPEDGPDAPDGTWTICEEDGRCWLVAEDDTPPPHLPLLALSCRALAAIAQALLADMAEDWKAEPPLTFDERVEQGPCGPGYRTEPGSSDAEADDDPGEARVPAIEELKTTAHPMHLTVDPWWGNLELLEFGTVTDGLPGSRFLTIDPDGRSAFVLDELRETITGFVVSDYNEGDPMPLEDERYWEGPRFDVPVLGLVSATAGEVVLAVRARYGDEGPTADAAHFHSAMDEDDLDLAAAQWRFALDAGDMKAHYGLGYTLCALGSYREAYDHLRRYTELVPTNGWAWNWLGQACEGRGELTEARAAYERAVEEAGEDTDAAEHLDGLGE